MIERQCQGLVEFVEPKHTLDLVVGQAAAKERLQQDADWISEGQLESAPMGYLFCGPVGTGKTFLAECYAGSIGIPCVVLRNFRSKYVGETEGNLEQVLTVLRSLGPGRGDRRRSRRRARQPPGRRRFGHVGPRLLDDRQPDGRHALSRPDHLDAAHLPARPVADRPEAARPGEVHIPLFYRTRRPRSRTMFAVMAKKNKVQLAEDAIPEVSPDRRLERGRPGKHRAGRPPQGARRRAARSSSEPTWKRPLDEFIPSAQGLEKEMQELAAVLECTERSFLPPEWRERLRSPGARAALAGADGRDPPVDRRQLDSNAIIDTSPASELPRERTTMATDKAGSMTTHANAADRRATSQKLTTFVDAMADGQIDDSELTAQEERLVAADERSRAAAERRPARARSRKLLCELTAYDMMQTLNSLQSRRPQTAFRG